MQELLTRAHQLAAEGQYDDIVALVAESQQLSDGAEADEAEADEPEAVLAEIGSLIPTTEPAWCAVVGQRVAHLVDQGDLSTATEEAREIHRHVQARGATQSGNVQWQTDMIASHDRLGALASLGEDPVAGVAHMEAALAIQRRLATADPTDAGRQWNLAHSHERLANVAMEAGDFATAGRNYRAALSIHQRFAAADPTDESWKLGASLAEQDLTIFEDTFARSVAFAESALRTTLRLSTAHPETLVFQRDLAVSHQDLGDLAMAADDPGRAYQHYHAAVEVAERLAATGTGWEQWNLDLPGLRRKVHETGA